MLDRQHARWDKKSLIPVGSSPRWDYQKSSTHLKGTLSKMTIKHYFCLGLIAVLSVFSGTAMADQVTINNQTKSTMYRIYAWPTELIPRTYNIITSPLKNEESREVTIDNSYQHCSFTFQYDTNNPSDMRRLGYKKKPTIFVVADICSNKGVVTITSRTL